MNTEGISQSIIKLSLRQTQGEPFWKLRDMHKTVIHLRSKSTVGQYYPRYRPYKKYKVT